MSRKVGITIVIGANSQGFARWCVLGNQGFSGVFIYPAVSLLRKKIGKLMTYAPYSYKEIFAFLQPVSSHPLAVSTNCIGSLFVLQTTREQATGHSRTVLDVPLKFCHLLSYFQVQYPFGRLHKFLARIFLDDIDINRFKGYEAIQVYRFGLPKAASSSYALGIPSLVFTL